MLAITSSRSMDGKNQNAPIEGIETTQSLRQNGNLDHVRIKMPRLRGLKPLLASLTWVCAVL